MAQKWNNHQPNVFNGFNNPSTSTHVENESLSLSSSGQISTQMHIVSQPHMMHVGNSFIVPVTEDVTKNTCIREEECGVRHNNSFLVSVGNASIVQQVSDAGVGNQEELEASHVRLTCFVCSATIESKNYTPIKSSMNHSGAPCLVLLTDVLGYKLDNTKLHSQVLCKACIHLLDIIDELQQTLTDSKTDVRTKFLDTVQRLKLKYPRTDKMLKPRCVRCVQMAQSNSKKRLRGGRNIWGKVADEDSRSSKTKDKTADLWDTSTHDNENPPAMEDSEPEIDVDNVTRDENSTSANLTNIANKDSDIIFDTDPAFFSSDEKLKVGVIKELNGMKAYLCIYCSIRYDSALPLKMHVRVFHMPVLVYDNGQGTPVTKYRMGIKLQNTSPTGMPTSEKPFACLFCESAYKLQSSLQSHFRDNHSPHKPYQCLECKETFRRPIEVSRHRLYRCPAKKMQALSCKR